MIFGFFSLASGKLIPYVLPAFPPLAIAIADSVMSIEERAGGSRRFAIAAMTTMALIGALMLAAPFAGLSTPYLSLVRPALLAAGLIAIAGAVIAGLSIARGRVEAAPAIVVLAIAAALIAGSYGRLEAEPLRSYAGLCRTIAAQAPAGSTLICYRRYVQGLPYYNRQRIVLVGAPSELNFGMEHSEDAASWFLTTDDELFRLWDTRGPESAGYRRVRPGAIALPAWQFHDYRVRGAETRNPARGGTAWQQLTRLNIQSAKTPRLRRRRQAIRTWALRFARQPAWR